MDGDVTYRFVRRIRSTSLAWYTFHNHVHKEEQEYKEGPNMTTLVDGFAGAKKDGHLPDKEP